MAPIVREGKGIVIVETPKDRRHNFILSPPMQLPSSSLLEKLPIELIYEVQLCALNEWLPVVNKSFYDIFTSTRPSYRAEYIFLRYLSRVSASYTRGQLVTHALTYPICTEDVLDTLLRLFSTERVDVQRGSRPLLSKRLFRYIWNHTRYEERMHLDSILRFVRYLYSLNEYVENPDPNSHEGYALVRAVHGGHMPLVTFLLGQGANPGLKDALSVRVAIRKRDLGLVRTLIEREAEEEYEISHAAPNENTSQGGSDNDPSWQGDRGAGNEIASAMVRKKRRKILKRRRVQDRVEVTTAMLRAAVEANAYDIAQYFLDKGARPDILTMRHLRHIGFV